MPEQVRESVEGGPDGSAEEREDVTDIGARDATRGSAQGPVDPEGEAAAQPDGCSLEEGADREDRPGGHRQDGQTDEEQEQGDR